MTKKMMTMLVVLAALAVAVWWFASRSAAPTPAVNVQTVTLTDALGRKVAVHAPTVKLITLTGADTETLVALGVKPLATTANFTMTDELTRALVDVPKVGTVTGPDVERIVALRPDLVLGSIRGFHTQLAQSMEKAGVPIAFLKADSYADILARIRLLGELSGREEKAAELVDGIEKKVATTRAQYAGRPAPKVLIVWGTAASFQLASSKTFVGDLVGQLPVINLADEFLPDLAKDGAGGGFVALDTEYLARSDADVVFVVTHGVARDERVKFVEAFKKQAAWQQLRAVRNGRVYDLPGELFAVNPNVRVADSVAYVGTVLYGEN